MPNAASISGTASRSRVCCSVSSALPLPGMIDPRKVLIVRRLGLRDYESTWRAMQSFTDRRDGDTADELWLLEHPPVYALGKAGRPEHVIDPGGIPVIATDRGGQVTYHGPGQLVAYILFDLPRAGIGVKRLVRLLEQAVVDLLIGYGIRSSARSYAPGVYVEGAKIAAVGLRIRRGCSLHGLALNVDLDLAPFSRIDPCGYPGLAVTAIAQLDAPAAIGPVGAGLTERIAHLLARRVISA